MLDLGDPCLIRLDEVEEKDCREARFSGGTTDEPLQNTRDARPHLDLDGYET